MSVILLGYRGSGKTTVGRLAAAGLGRAFVDLDEVITATAGRSIKEIFADEGEQGFRDRESAALSQVLGTPDNVLSLGGGAVLRESNRAALLASGRERIYLRAPPEILAARIAADPATSALRPNLIPGSRGAADIEEVRRVLAAREPIYRALMTREVDVTYRTPAEVAADILSCP